MKEIRAIITSYHTARSQRIRTVLATVVHVEGSSYRSAGARMLIREDGTMVGAISGGCLEGDALRNALLVMMEGEPMLVTYDTRAENDVFGVGLGCNGVIRVLLEPLPLESISSPITLLEALQEKRQPGVLLTYYTPEDKKNKQQGTKLVASKESVQEIGQCLGLKYVDLKSDINRVFNSKCSLFFRYEGPGDNGVSVYVFAEYLPPIPRLVVAGAGNDIFPLMEMAKLLGWELALLDGRPTYAQQDRFPGCQVVMGDPKEALGELGIDEWTAVLLMSHNYEYDKSVLTQVISGPARYIGVLGPKKKRKALLEGIKNAGIKPTKAQIDRIYGPVGLDIGAETCDEIALSIISGIKAAFSGKSGGELRNGKGPIHERFAGVSPSLSNYGILILAAGSSKRLGRAKQTLEINGESLLRKSAREALKVGAGVTVVVLSQTADSQVKKQVEDLRLDIVLNANDEEGIASSIRAGIAHISEKYPHLSHVLMMLCDQPYVDTFHLEKLIKKQAESGNTAIAASYYGERHGVPAIFHRSLFSSLMELTGDTGAKNLIGKYREVGSVFFPMGEVDVDTETDYLQVKESEPEMPKRENPGLGQDR